MTPPQVAVLGLGFIGRHVVRSLLDAGVRVRALRRNPMPPPADFEVVVGDAADPKVLAEVLTGCDAAVHLVGSTYPGSTTPIETEATDTILTGIRILDACGKAGIRRVVYVSSGGTVYGRTNRLPIPEAEPTEPISAYGISRLAMEKYTSLLAARHGFTPTILRVANAYGPFQQLRDQGVIARFLSLALRKQPLEIWGNGGVLRDFLYVEDVADAILRALQSDAPGGIFNIGNGVGVSILEVAEAVRAEIGGALDIRFLPGRDADVPASVLDIAKARAELGWAPRIDFNSGLALTAAWFKQQFQLGDLQ